jgi:hypothetical protein
VNVKRHIFQRGEIAKQLGDIPDFQERSLTRPL